MTIRFWRCKNTVLLRTNYSPLLCVRSKLMPCGGMHKFLWNGYSADKWRWDVGAGGVFQRALAPEMASEVVWDDTPVASLLSSRQESTKSFWLPDWKEEDIFLSQNYLFLYKSVANCHNICQNGQQLTHFGYWTEKRRWFFLSQNGIKTPKILFFFL